MVYYDKVKATLEPVIQSAQKDDTLSAQPHLEKLKSLSIVSKSTPSKSKEPHWFGNLDFNLLFFNLSVRFKH